MSESIAIAGAGLAGSEAALQLADRGFTVFLYEMRPDRSTAVHRTERAAELVCSNSLRSMKPESAAGMLKSELAALSSHLYACALSCAVPAGGALAVDRDAFAERVTDRIEAHPGIELVREEVCDLADLAGRFDAVIVASGPLTSDGLAEDLSVLTGVDHLAFFDAAAPVVMADSLDRSKLFRQSRYEGARDDRGDYLNAPFSREEYEAFIDALVSAERVVERDFESRDLFQACQPIEEIARTGRDAPRFGALKPVGLTDPRTKRRPWAALQLRAENAHATSFNLVGFQTNLKFGEQERVFRMVPGLERAEFARFGVMHRNTFVDAPRLLGPDLRLRTPHAEALPAPVYIVGQLGGTEGYCEAIRSGLHAALCVVARLRGLPAPVPPIETAFGALIAYATDPATADYQPMHVNRGTMVPLEQRVKSKEQRYAAYAARAEVALSEYCARLRGAGLLSAGER